MYGLSGKEFLSALRTAMARRGTTPKARLLGLWEALEGLSARDDFAGSFAARAAIAVRDEPDQPVSGVVAQHHKAVRTMLEEMVCEEPAQSPRLAGQLELLVEGAIAGAAIDQDPATLRAARELSMIALSLNGYQA